MKMSGLTGYYEPIPSLSSPVEFRQKWPNLKLIIIK